MNIDERLEKLQGLIGLKFADTANLKSAISHSSFVIFYILKTYYKSEIRSEEYFSISNC